MTKYIDPVSLATFAGPASVGCWLYHNVTALSNQTANHDGDYYRRVAAPTTGCMLPKPNGLVSIVL